MLFLQQPYLYDEERSPKAPIYRFMISLLQSSNDSHLIHSNYLYTISSMFSLWNIQQLSIRASWFVTRNHDYLVIAKQSLCWANMSCAVSVVLNTPMYAWRQCVGYYGNPITIAQFETNLQQINEFHSYLIANKYYQDAHIQNPLGF